MGICLSLNVTIRRNNIVTTEDEIMNIIAPWMNKNLISSIIFTDTGTCMLDYEGSYTGGSNLQLAFQIYTMHNECSVSVIADDWEQPAIYCLFEHGECIECHDVIDEDYPEYDYVFYNGGIPLYAS